MCTRPAQSSAAPDQSRCNAAADSAVRSFGPLSPFRYNGTSDLLRFSVAADSCANIEAGEKKRWSGETVCDIFFLLIFKVIERLLQEVCS
jgi:hypothetical protein